MSPKPLTQMWRLTISALCGFLVFGPETALACLQEHEVTSLPGWDEPLPSKQYSGLLPVADGTKHLHYWLVLSERDPGSDPLVLWLNGGPGASSLVGYLTELGPFLLSDASDKHPVHGVPALLRNKNTWAREASVLFLESPAGVGFSYCEDGDDCVNTDESTADDSADFMMTFYKHYPELLKRDLFLTGESYAGVYLPMLAERLLKEQPEVPLRGLAAGNGCWGTSVGLCAEGGDAMAIRSQFYQAHNMISDGLWEQLQANCNWYHVSDKCQDLVAEMNDQIGEFWQYNIYDTCALDQATLPTGLVPAANQTFTKAPVRDFNFWHELTPARTYRQRPEVMAGMGGYACGADRVMAEYLSSKVVADALHVKRHTSGMQYKLTVPDLRPLYKWLSEHTRMLIYSGDVDGCVPTWGTEHFFLRALGMPIEDAWAPWKCKNENGFVMKAGYHMKFGGTKFGIDFATINGAGHMVPQYKPVEMQALISRWLADKPLKGERRHAGMTMLP